MNNNETYMRPESMGEVLRDARALLDSLTAERFTAVACNEMVKRIDRVLKHEFSDSKVEN